MQDTDWDDLRVFGTLARTGSFAAAALELGQHETTVARRVRRLEAHVGHVLWRGPDGGLTDDGADLARHVARMADEAGVGLATLQGAHMPRGTVRLTTVPWVVDAAVLPTWAAWRQEARDVSLSVLGGHDSLNLLHGEADIALRFARPEAHGDVVIRKLGDVPFVVAGAGPDWVGYVPEMGHLPQAQWTSAVGGNVGVRLSDQASVTAAVRAGLGRGWVPRCLAGAHDPAIAPRTRPLWCLTHPRTRNAPAVRLLCDQFLPLVARALCQ